MSVRIERSWGIVAGVVTALAVAACGSASGRVGSESGARANQSTVHARFPVKMTTASFPATQRLAQSTRLVIAVRNAGHRTLPDVAVSICNTSCAPSHRSGVGTAAQAFGQDASGAPGVADATRPVWIVTRAPGACRGSCVNPGGEAGSAVTANSNTWALGRLAPGRTARFSWTVTAVAAGRHVVAWQVAGDLTGAAKVTLDTGGRAQGRFKVRIARAPAHTSVTPSGQLVTSSR